MSRRILQFILVILVVAFAKENANAATYYSRASGNWNSTSSWSTSSYSGSAATSVPGSGSNDVVLISGYTITVTATPAHAVSSLIFSQNNNTGNDTKLYLNTSGITLTCNALSVNDNNLADNMDIDIAQGTFQVNGTATFVRTTSNAQDQRLKLYIHNTGRVNITGNLIYTLNRAQNNFSAENEIQLDNSGRLDVNGNLTVTIGNTSGTNNEFNFVMNNSSVCNVGGNASFTISNSDDGDDLILSLNGGTFTITGTLTGTIATTATSSNSLHMYINGATVSTGALTFVQSGGGNGDMDIKLNSTSTLSAASLTVNGNLTFTHNNGDNMEIETNGNSTLTITQDLSILLSASADGDNVYLDFNGGTVNANNGTITVAGGATSANFLYWNIDGSIVNFSGNLKFIQNGGGGTGDVDFFINANSTVSTSSVTIAGDLNFSHNGGDNYEIELNNNSSLTVSGNLIDTLISNDGDDFYIDINGGVFTVNQDFKHIQTTSGGTTEDLNIRIDGSGKFNINNDVYIDHRVGGQVSIYTNYSTGSTAEFNVGGNFTIYHAAAADGDYIETDQSSKFTVGGNFLMTNNASGADNARIKMSNTSTISIGGNLTMNLLSGSTAVADNIEMDLNGGIMTVGGNLTLYSTAGNDAFITVDGNSTSLIINDTLKLFHTGGDNSYITLGNGTGSPTVTVGELTLNQTGGTKTYCRLYNSSILNVNGDITLSALAASKVDIGVYSTSQIKIGGNFVRAASPSRYGVLSCASTSTVEYNGSTQQTIAGNAGSGSDDFTYGNLKLNNDAGFLMTGTEGNVTIPSGSSLIFNVGIVYSSLSSFFVISSGASVSGASNLSYVDGPIRKVGNTAFIFPIGDNGNYQPAGISAPSNVTYHFTAQYFAANPGLLHSSSSLSGIDHISKCEYWNIDRTNGTSNVNITLYFDAGSCGITDLAALRIAKWDGTAWASQGNGGTTGNTSAGTIVNGITVSTYLAPNTTFTLSSSNASNPLPVSLLKFDASVIKSEVALNWSTASESGNDYFEIQRSENGVDFEKIAKVKGAGNSNSLINYQFIDPTPFENISYYRIKQVDYNGDFTFTNIKSVNIHKPKTLNEVSVYPNPVSGNIIHINLNNPEIFSGKSPIGNIELYDVSGKLVYTTSIPPGFDFKGNLALDFNQQPEKGIYLLKITMGDFTFNNRLVIN